MGTVDYWPVDDKTKQALPYPSFYGIMTSNVVMNVNRRFEQARIA